MSCRDFRWIAHGTIPRPTGGELLSLLIGLAVFYAFFNGYRDSSSILAGVLASRAMRPRLALYVVAAAWVIHGWQAVIAPGVLRVVLPLLAAPFVGFAVGFVVMALLMLIFSGATPRINILFRR